MPQSGTWQVPTMGSCSQERTAQWQPQSSHAGNNTKTGCHAQQTQLRQWTCVRPALLHGTWRLPLHRPQALPRPHFPPLEPPACPLVPFLTTPHGSHHSGLHRTSSSCDLQRPTTASHCL
ncbi:hypothetical protein EI555_012451, partial [Monodon monoceros]